MRFIICWWSGYYKDEGCSKPPFKCWEDGLAQRMDGTVRTDIRFLAVINAEDEYSALAMIKKHFPDMERRFVVDETRFFDDPR